MEIEQTTELTYTKVDDIDKKVNQIIDLIAEVNPENSSSVKSDLTTIKNKTTDIKTYTTNLIDNVNSVKSDTLINLDKTIQIDTNVINIKTSVENVNTNVESVKTTVENNNTKLDEILENQASGGNFDTTNLENQIAELSTNLSSINTNITNISGDITTTNSNVATNKSNISSIKSTVEHIENNMPTNTQNKIIDAKLNEILKDIKTIKGSEEFTEDPYKLDLPYTERLEINRNPNNYDYIECDKEISGRNGFFVCLAHCTGSTFKYSFKINFTADASAKVTLYGNCKTVYQNFSAGTHTYEATYEDVTTSTGDINFQFYASNSPITVHYIKIELWGENITIVPKRNKFKIYTTIDKIFINKLENNNGYYLVLDDKNYLTPELLNKEFTLDVENVLDYNYTKDLRTYYNKTFSLFDFKSYILLNGNYHSEFANGFSKTKVDGIASVSCCLGYTNISYFYNARISFNNTTGAKLNTLSTMFTNSESASPKDYNTGKICKVVMVQDLFVFDKSSDRNIYIVTKIDGTNFIFINSNCTLDIGYGNNVTAYFDKDNPLKINVYMNDNGYCVKYILNISEDKTSIEILSKKIIGTYDAYFETDSDVYFVEKDNKLLMYKK